MVIPIPDDFTLGCRLTAIREGGLGDGAVYPDPKTGTEPWTGPFGITGVFITQPSVTVVRGLALPADAWIVEYRARYARDGTQAAVDLGAAYWADLDEVRQAVLADIVHQDGAGNAATGTGGLASYHRMLAAIRVKDWPTSSMECRDSLNEVQTKSRCDENAQMLASGSWPVWLLSDA